MVELILIVLLAFVLLAYLLEKLEALVARIIPFLATIAVVVLICVQIPAFRGIMHNMWQSATKNIPAITTAVAEEIEKIR